MSKYFPDLHNDIDDADVEQIKAAFTAVQNDVTTLQTEIATKADTEELAGISDEVADNAAALADVKDALKNKVDKVTGKGLSSYDFSYSYKSKLDGIDKGAQKNTVTSVAGKTGAVVLDKSDVGLDNVDNTADMDKPVSTAVQAELDDIDESLAAISATASSADGVARNAYSTAMQTQAEAAKKFKYSYQKAADIDSLVLTSHTDIRFVYDKPTALTITMPSDYSDDYECYLYFGTGDTPTTLTYSDTPIKWVGVDCDSDGNFIPTANRNYEIAIKNLGSPSDAIIVARVGVC